MRVKIEPVNPLQADRELTLQVRPQGQRDAGLVLEQDVEIPAGAASVEVALAWPATTEWAVYGSSELVVLEDEQPLAGLTVSWIRWNSQIVREDGVVCILAVDPPSADTSAIEQGLASANWCNIPVSQRGYARPLPSSGGQVSVLSATACRMDALPERWIEFSGLDCVLIGLDRLEMLKQKRPEAHRALVQWAFAGGNLLVYGTGAGGEDFARLRCALAWPKGSQVEPQEDWVEPKDAAVGDGTAAPGDFETSEATPVQAAPAGERAPMHGGKPPFLLRRFGQGMVVAIPSESPLPGDAGDWRLLFENLGPHRWDWVQRHGVMPGEANADFWNFMIPGVGLAPVKTFCALITLFACVIGPLNYWLFKRKRRLHLLVVTIPGGALLVTLAMFGYAILADGLSTRVRMRSVTVIDQKRNLAACWTRNAYYAGLSPRDGLAFSEDTAVFPIPREGTDRRRAGAVQQAMSWNGGQKLSTGWIAARTPAQYLTVRSRAADCGLKMIAAEEGGNPQVENRLGSKIETLVIRGPGTKLFWVESVENGARAALIPIEPLEARVRMRRVVDSHAPAFPSIMGNGGQWSPFNMRRNYNSPMRFHGSAQYVSTAAGVLEQSIAAELNLHPQSYAAVVERSPEVNCGVAGAHEEAGFHLILGSW